MKTRDMSCIEKVEVFSLAKIIDDAIDCALIGQAP